MDTMLGEMIVHAEDIRRPLGIKHAYPVAAVTRTAQFFTGSNLLIGAKRRITGLTLRATDTDWSHGTGPGGRRPGPVASHGHDRTQGGDRRPGRRRRGDTAGATQRPL